ncbi:MAG: hypothetical protein ABSG43_14540, partial [Solirubrobacteraceae bacterium]
VGLIAGVADLVDAARWKARDLHHRAQAARESELMYRDWLDESHDWLAESHEREEHYRRLLNEARTEVAR